MISDTKKAELDAVADERAATLGVPHVIDGAQPYHAGAIVPDEHVPGSALIPAVEVEPVAIIPEEEQSNG